MPKPLVAVATSGGRDSTALLHCTIHQARACGADVLALHVHHGLMAEADAWLSQVRAQARRWGAAFDGRQLTETPPAGESVEAWARVQRYKALTEMAHTAGCTLVLLAHHRRDQAETWLLQALRGAGHLGLAAMPRMAHRHGITWARPWLDLPREAIEAYVRRHRLQHVDDRSNADPRFARSRLRQQVWPALVGAFPEAEQQLALAASHAHEASELAEELSQLDLLACAGAEGLALGPWMALSPARRSNVLRAWLRRALGAAAPLTLVQRLLAELPAVRSGRWPARDAELALHRGLLSLRPVPVAAAAAGEPTTLDLREPGLVALPTWQGALRVERVSAGGIPVEALASLRLHSRGGGERFRFAPRATARSLKKQYQARGIPAWARDAPLISTPDGRLVFVPGLGIDAAFQAAEGTEQRSLTWVPQPPGRRQRPD